MGRHSIPIKLRLEQHRLITPDGHWIFTGRIGASGHGQIGYQGRVQSVHRVAYTVWVGPPKGLVCHKSTCGIKACFNPDHLYDGDYVSNYHDTPRHDTNKVFNGNQFIGPVEAWLRR